MHRDLEETIKASAKVLGVPPESISNIMIHAETPMGTMVLHTLPSGADYVSLMKMIANDESLIDLTIEGT